MASFSCPSYPPGWPVLTVPFPPFCPGCSFQAVTKAGSVESLNNGQRDAGDHDQLTWDFLEFLSWLCLSSKNHLNFPKQRSSLESKSRLIISLTYLPFMQKISHISVQKTATSTVYTTESGRVCTVHTVFTNIPCMAWDFYTRWSMSRACVCVFSPAVGTH